MEIDKAIKVLKCDDYTAGDYERIIDLLEELGKYKYIVEDLEHNYGFLSHYYNGSDSTDRLEYVIPRLKEKYSLREVISYDIHE